MRKNAPTDVSVSETFSGVITPGLPLPGGGDPLPGHRPARPQAPRMLRPPRIKNPPRMWAGYGPVGYDDS